MGVFLNTMRWLRRKGIAGTALCVACLALALFASTASATFPGANGRIAFVGPDPDNPNGKPMIHTIQPDGSADQALAEGFDPSWSPDGRHIVFWKWAGLPQRQVIFAMRADGSDLRRVGKTPYSEGDASYAPNGHRILFARGTSGGQAVIATMRVDGSDERILARGLVGPIEYSPDGGRILLSNGCRLWDMRPNGSHRRQLPSGHRPPRKLPCDSRADYSPDGKHIRFIHGNDPYVMRSDGSRAHEVACGGIFSPDGHELAAALHIGQPRSELTDIFTLTTRCANPFRVTHYGEMGNAAGEPSWQPLP